MTEYSQKQLKEAIDKSCTSNYARSSRRLFFTHCNQTIKERGKWHADYLWGSGSAILIKLKNRFFLVTAKHVIQNNIGECLETNKFQNEAPFISLAKSDKAWSSIEDFLFPARFWHIEENIEPYDWSIDLRDVILVELFSPSEESLPNNFINLDDPHIKDTIKNFEPFKGQFLICSGYQKLLNDYDYEEIDEFTHSTELTRKLIMGLCDFEDNEPIVDLSKTKGGPYSQEIINGMSGGLILNVHPEEANLAWVGMILTAGNDKIRFCPANILISAIENYLDTKHEIIDPAANNIPIYISEEDEMLLAWYIEHIYSSQK